MRGRPSLIYGVCLRFDSLKAITVSRHTLKTAMRAEALATKGVTLPFALSTGRIHADKTLETYKGVALRYARWARATYGVTTLADLDARADPLVTVYLVWRLEAGDRPSSLKTARSALRMFHRPAYPLAEREDAVRALGADVALPPRRHAGIVRSRTAVAMDREIAVARYASLIAVCRATGLRRREIEALTVGDVQIGGDGRATVHVRNGKGGRSRLVPVLPGHEDDVRVAVENRLPHDVVFPRIPVRLDIHAYRRQYAQDLYCEDGRRSLPPSQSRLTPGAVDQERALYVARALGHNRTDIVVRHYLR